jgi:haloalkane dehalogenase
MTSSNPKITPTSNGYAGASDPISADDPFEPRRISVREAAMSYIDEGEGDPILFLHGNCTWSYLWRNIPHVRGQGRMLAPDPIGIGLSDKPQLTYGFFDHVGYLEDFIGKLDLSTITLVVHDWDSGLGFHYAARLPEMIKAIAMMEPLIEPWDSWSTFPIRFREQFRAFRDPSKAGKRSWAKTSSSK